MIRGPAALCVLGLLAACAAAPDPAPVAAPPDPLPGSYVVLLEDPDGNTGSVVVEGPRGRTTLRRPLEAANLDGSTRAPVSLPRPRVEREFAAALAASPPQPAVYRLYFRSGAAALEPASERLVDDILDDARTRPAADVSIVGHTDTEGDEAMNTRLGMDRARWIAALLRKRGLAAVELTITSHGEHNPLVRTPDNTAEARNRRVEVIVR